MTPEQIDLIRSRNWSATLRSGKYPQTRTALHRSTHGFGLPAGDCCLGIYGRCCGLTPDQLVSGVFTPSRLKPDQNLSYPNMHTYLPNPDYEALEALGNYIAAHATDLLPRNLIKDCLLVSQSSIDSMLDGDFEGQDLFTELNDKFQLTFPQIADIIDAALTHAEKSPLSFLYINSAESGGPSRKTTALGTTVGDFLRSLNLNPDNHTVSVRTPGGRRLIEKDEPIPDNILGLAVTSRFLT